MPNPVKLSQDKIANRLYKATEAKALRMNFKLGQGADGDLRSKAKHAASEILKFQALTNVNLEGLVRNNEIVFAEIAEQMIQAAYRIPGYAEAHPGIIGEDTLRDVLLRFCPLWPVC